MELSKEQKDFVDGLNKSIAELKAQIETAESKAEKTETVSKEVEVLKEALEATKKELESTKEVATKQGEKINELSTPKTNYVRANSYEDVLRQAIEENKEAFEAFKTRKTNTFSISLVEKAAGNMTVAGNVTPDSVNVVSTGVEAGYVDILPVEPLIESYCNTGTTNNSIIQYIEKVNRDGSTIFIGEGDAKNQIDFDWKKNQSTAKKVADYIKVSDEMLSDISFMAAAIENELRYQIDLNTSAAVLTGDGLGDNLKGITAYAQAYTLTTVKTTTPNTLDAIHAASTQIRVNNGRVTHVFLNPVDYANLKIAKGTTGYYAIVDGMVTMLPFQVVDNNQISVGKILVADMTKSIVRNYKPFTVEYGWENDDFTKNMVTVRGERRLHHYIADNHTPCFVYDDISDIITAVTA